LSRFAALAMMDDLEEMCGWTAWLDVFV
jgi:hypothetical protein